MSKSRSPKSSARSGTTRPKPGPATGGPSSGAPGKAAADPGKTVPASATPSDTSARPLGSSATPTSSGAPSSATPPAGKATPPAKAAPAAKASPAAARTELVRADRLNVGYGTKAVCGEIGFSLRQGEALAFVGPNGAGKSTVLKTVVGQLEAISGKTRVYGGDADDRSLEFRREVAMVFDDDAFFPALTVQEHLAIVAAGHGATDVEDLIDDELDFFGLTEQRQMLPAQPLLRPAPPDAAGGGVCPSAFAAGAGRAGAAPGHRYAGEAGGAAAPARSTTAWACWWSRTTRPSCPRSPPAPSSSPTRCAK